MSDLKISRRYAIALYEFAVEEKLIDKISNDMLLIAATCNTSKELMSFLKSPVIKSSKKSEVLDLIFKSSIQKVTGNYIKIITLHRREIFLPMIANEFINIHKDAMGIKVAYIKTAVPLDDNINKILIDLLEKQTGSKIELDVQVREDLIGGIVLSLDNNEIDTSIKNKLIRLQSEFNHNPYEKKY